MSEGRASTAPAAARSEPPAIPRAAADAEILAAIERGETRLALSLCAQRHGASIGRLCMAMLGSQTDADDLTQETLLAAHQSFGDYRSQGSLRGWLLGIARNKCLQHLEKTRRRSATLARGSAGTANTSLDEVPNVAKRAARARALLEQVRPSDRDALLLRFGADLSFKEVAAACGIDEPAARKRVSRALMRLRSALENENDDD